MQHWNVSYKEIIMKKISLFILAGLALATTFTNALASEPEACPSIAAVESGGFDNMIKSSEIPNSWVAYKNKSTYGTNDEWTFVTIVTSKNASEAQHLIRAKLATVTAFEGPLDGGDNTWGCVSQEGSPGSEDFFFAAAVTPPQEVTSSALAHLK
jgi:hypothetical protein